VRKYKMNNQTYFDQEALINDTIRVIKGIEYSAAESEEFDSAYYASSEDDSELAKAKKITKDLVKRQDIRQLICPALKSGKCPRG
jgi:hypothetical protein